MNLATKDEHEYLREKLEMDPNIRIATFGFSNGNDPATYKDFDLSKIAVNFDNNSVLWGGVQCLNCKTISPSEAIKYDIPIVIYSCFYVEISKQLDGYGIKKYYIAHLLKNEIDIDTRTQLDKNIVCIQNNLDKINIVRALMCDTRSVEVFDSIIRCRKEVTQWGVFELMINVFSQDQYFPGDIPEFVLSDKECFVDAGAYYGDTISAFLQKTKEKYSHIYVFEPDNDVLSRLNDFCSPLKNVSLYNICIYSHKTNISMQNDEIFGNDVNLMQADSLDSILDNKPVTFIKMDIEGSEKEAIQGASNIIKTQRPKLAICIYHYMSDLWEIPLLLHEIVPEYKFYIRHHSYGFYETVLYAV